LEVPIEEEGFLYTYLSNEPGASASSSLVYFDDFTVAQQSYIVQVDDYYPFGLTHSQPLPGQLKNRYLWSGKERQTDLGLNWDDFGARFYDPALGRFHTQDRFADKYHPLTPYQYAANNPINVIDINGDSLWIQINKNSQALYVDGSVYNADGTAYTGKGTRTDKNGNTKLTGFLKRTVSNLDQISSGKEGNKLVDEIQGSSKNVTITKGSSGNSYDSRTNEVEFDLSSQTGGLNTKGSNSRPTYIGLAHELAHSLDDIRGTLSGKTVANTNQAEIFASHIENLVRAENFLPLRSQYNVGSPLIDSFGNSIYYGTSYYGNVQLQNRFSGSPLQSRPARSLVPTTTMPKIRTQIGRTNGN
jgi:RHS repeat-associated protein